jgi:predicted nucleic acid-binding protein
MTVRKTIDMLIGTFCAMHACPLLHADQDFDRMSRLIGLQVVRPH